MRVMFDEVSRADYLRGHNRCDICGRNDKKLFFYSRHPLLILCAECIVVKIREKMDKNLYTMNY